MRSRVLAGALLLLGLLASSQAALLAVDLGSEFLKVSLVKPGRTPIAVVINEMSKRRSPALSGVVWDERIVGEEAFSLGVRYPEAIIARAHDLLGKTADDPSIAAMLKAHALPFKVEAHPTRGTAAVNIGGKLYSAEELVVRASGLTTIQSSARLIGCMPPSISGCWRLVAGAGAAFLTPSYQCLDLSGADLS